eukprot:TRINITY_DN8864_c0_g1_i2.p1 TRINITY_DN8864_c0_g1~~TRINITY_DN8864_c0_g1_i2.p1  ORF type:complete len:415 (-),score=104.77 TRINITY_DN8864_c0_g1_i2:113-1357(-)
MSISGQKNSYSMRCIMFRFYRDGFASREKRWVDTIFYERFSNDLFDINPITSEVFTFHDWPKTVLEKTMMRAGGAGLPNLSPPSDEVEEAFRRKNKLDEELAKTVEAAIKDNSNPFRILIERFRIIFCKHFEDLMKEFQAEKFEEYKSHKLETGIKKEFVPKAMAARSRITQEAFESLKKFINLLIDCLSDMYNTSFTSSKAGALKELLMNALLEIIIDSKIYALLFMLLKAENKEEETVIDKQIERLKEVRPVDLGISPFHCLDESVMCEKVLKNIKANAEDSAWEKLLEDRIQANTAPYMETIHKLGELISFDTPMAKLRSVIDLNPSICRCVDKFWKDIPVSREKLQIDADQYLSILTYIVIKTNVKDLFTHANLANEFASLGSTSSYSAYAITTLQVSFYRLLNIDDIKK